MDKKLILYLLILVGLITATVISAKSSKKSENGTTLSNDEIEMLVDTGRFDIDPNEGSLIPLYEEGTQLTREQLGDGGEPSPQLISAYDKYLGENDEGSPLITFALFIGTGIFVGFLIVSYVLPNLVQKASEEVYGSTEKVGPPSPLSQAQANVAQGDWDQAIASYQQAAVDDPSNRLPWVEIAMLQRERLENPNLALQTLDNALARGGWRENDEAFFLFRKIEIYENDLDQHAQAVALLREVMEKFPKTRHYANAMHKLHEMGES
ncbi:MAG: tetratricopeptide repeat protein [Roseibacillus sp.]